METFVASEGEAPSEPAGPARSLVQCMGKNRFEEIEPLSEPPGADAQDFRNLPLVLKEPTVVRIADRYYPLEKEGLYRFFDIGGCDMRQAYLYLGDVWQLAGHLSQMHVHGWRGQDALAVEEKVERARRGRLCIICSPTAVFMTEQLRQLGIGCRFVCTLTFEEWNDYDNGHALVEIFDPGEGRWLLYDSDLGCRLRHGGRWLDLGEVCRLCRQGGTPEADYPAGRCRVDPHADEMLPSKSLFHSLLFESVFQQDAARDAWYRRVFQLPVIDGVFPSDVEAETARARAYQDGEYARERLPWAEWRARFYGS